MKASRQAGYSLVELLIAAALTLAISGAVLALVTSAQADAQVQPEASDLHQRLRAAADALAADLLEAGAGPDQGPSPGGLNRLFSPILPYRAGGAGDDPSAGVLYRRDAITLVWVPDTAVQTALAAPLASASSGLKVETAPPCPAGRERCGIGTGADLLVFDAAGAWDVLQVTGDRGAALDVRARGARLDARYAAGAAVAEGRVRTYYLDEVGNRLMRGDGLAADLPLVDDVVALWFDYYGDPRPPRAPRPPPGSANCLFDRSGAPALPALTAAPGSLVELPPATLADGPWCGAGGPHPFDADLLRVRAVRITLAVQAAAVALRGVNRQLFARPGSGRDARRLLPDLRVSFEVAPRNLDPSAP